jgi:hypothetical protein
MSKNVAIAPAHQLDTILHQADDCVTLRGFVPIRPRNPVPAEKGRSDITMGCATGSGVDCAQELSKPLPTLRRDPVVWQRLSTLKTEEPLDRVQPALCVSHMRNDKHQRTVDRGTIEQHDRHPRLLVTTNAVEALCTLTDCREPGAYVRR